MALCDEYHITHSQYLEWPAEDRAKTMAFRYEKAERCQMCGTAKWEWDNDSHAFMVEETFCLGCYQKHVAQEDRRRLPGTTIELVRTTPQKVASLKIMEEKRRRMSE